MPYMRESKARNIYLEIIDLLDDRKLLPHEFVEVMMTAYESQKNLPDRSVHGRFFEYVVGETLAQNGVERMYYQAEVRHVPLSTFDWFLFHETHPVSISCKTKARDRWKQAAHEAMALKHVYVQATNYLVTIERVSASEDKKRLAPFTIDHFVVANKPEYTEAVINITRKRYEQAVDQSPIRNGDLVSPVCID